MLILVRCIPGLHLHGNWDRSMVTHCDMITSIRGGGRHMSPWYRLSPLSDWGHHFSVNPWILVQNMAWVSNLYTECFVVSVHINVLWLLYTYTCFMVSVKQIFSCFWAHKWFVVSVHTNVLWFLNTNGLWFLYTQMVLVSVHTNGCGFWTHKLLWFLYTQMVVVTVHTNGFRFMYTQMVCGFWTHKNVLLFLNTFCGFWTHKWFAVSLQSNVFLFLYSLSYFVVSPKNTNA